MTELLLLLLIIVLTGSFFSLQKKLNPFVLPAGADRSSPKTNNAWFATTCAGYTSVSDTVEVVYHPQEPDGNHGIQIKAGDLNNRISFSTNTVEK